MREGASEQSSDLKNYTAPGPRPRFLNFWIRYCILSASMPFLQGRVWGGVFGGGGYFCFFGGFLPCGRGKKGLSFRFFNHESFSLFH